MKQITWFLNCYLKHAPKWFQWCKTKREENQKLLSTPNVLSMSVRSLNVRKAKDLHH